MSLSGFNLQDSETQAIGERNNTVDTLHSHKPDSPHYTLKIILFLLVLFSLYGCSGHGKAIKIEATGYCGCGQCCGWERGSWKFLKLDFWNRYTTTGKNRGREYSGLTASGTIPQEPNPGLLRQPWCILFPWLWFPQDGTLAADTNYYPFGTRFYIPGYGYGVVEDRGSAIQGKHIDLFFKSHNKALDWGNRNMEVKVWLPKK